MKIRIYLISLCIAFSLGCEEESFDEQGIQVSFEQSENTKGTHLKSSSACVPIPSNLAAWWRAENDMKDAIGGYDLQGTPSCASGRG